MAFKIGDRVKLMTTRYGDLYFNPVWGGDNGFVGRTIKEIRETNISLPIEVDWDNEHYNSYLAEDLALLFPKTIKDKKTINKLIGN